MPLLARAEGDADDPRALSSHFVQIVIADPARVAADAHQASRRWSPFFNAGIVAKVPVGSQSLESRGYGRQRPTPGTKRPPPATNKHTGLAALPASPFVVLDVPPAGCRGWAAFLSKIPAPARPLHRMDSRKSRMPAADRGFHAFPLSQEERPLLLEALPWEFGPTTSPMSGGSVPDDIATPGSLTASRGPEVILPG